MVVHIGNPFIATRQELVALDTQKNLEQVVVTSLSQTHAMGQALHTAYVTKRLEKASVPISDTISRNNMFTFANRLDRKRKGKKYNCTQKQNMTLITQLFLSLQSRLDADMMDFFRIENQRESPSLADQGSLRAVTMSDVLECLNAPTGCAFAATQATVVMLVMAALIHMVHPTTAKTFNEYVLLNIIPFLEDQMKNTTQCIDAVWDNYSEENNLKALAQHATTRK